MSRHSNVPALWRISTLAGILIVLTFGAWIRFADLGSRPIHADEGTGAWILAQRLDNRYAFYPEHFHGPLLSAIASPWSRIRGESSWLELTPTTLRQVVAVCGFLSIAGLLALGLKPLPTLLAMAFVATSPLLVYYSRMYIHETVFVATTVLSLAGLLMVVRGTRPLVSGLVLGLGIGAMAVTRETVVITLGAWLLAGFLFLARESAPRAWMESLRTAVSFFGPSLLIALVVAFGMIVVFYGYGEAGPLGFLGFFRSYLVYEPVLGHEKAPGFYAWMLLWPKFQGGTWWTEGAIFVLGMGVYFSRWSDRTGATGRFFMDAGLILLVLYSLVSYKTPWLACTAWLHVCLAAACGVVVLGKQWPWLGRSVFAVFLAGVLTWQVLQARQATGRFASDGRNPYAYVPTSSDLPRIPAWIEDLRLSLPGISEAPLAVIGDQYWPLPWYLRESGPVGYWSALPATARDYPIILVVPSALEQTGREIEETHILLPRGMRDDAPVFVAVRKDVWIAYQARD